MKSSSPDTRPTSTQSIWDYFAFRRSSNQIPELDGLRGIAIILVLLRHGVQPYMGGDLPLLPIFGWDAATFMTNGWIGVDLFFVLSGFLISFHIMNMADRVNGPWPWRSYIAKRVLRIVPAYYATILLVIIGAFPLYEFSREVIGFRIAYHLLFLQDYLPANIIVAFWSLGVEEKFYILAPFIVLAIAGLPKLSLRVAGVVALLLLGVAARVWTARLYPGVDNYVEFFFVFRSPFHVTLDPILLGVLLAFLYRSREAIECLSSKIAANLAFWTGLGIFLALSASGDMMKEITWWDKTLQPLVIGLGFFGMAYGLLFGGGVREVFRSTILFVFARISYSLYLVHLALVPFAMAVAQSLVGPTPSFAAFFPIFAGISILVSLMLHYAVEKPFLVLKDRIR